MESDEFGSNANGPSGEEDVVNAKLDYKGGRIREFNHKVGGGKESLAHANTRSLNFSKESGQGNSDSFILQDSDSSFILSFFNMSSVREGSFNLSFNSHRRCCCYGRLPRPRLRRLRALQVLLVGGALVVFVVFGSSRLQSN
ncbi:hypothetical protein OIU79_024713 [Salix purpurea]|uniref:Uncharacterized protein n=1 Tax=Salix purpurea TaxID=77065 RepID=A0A9Q1A6G8_SALPP|nr:hypothetical protein OIU79_024713 [Salix purpurea]